MRLYREALKQSIMDPKTGAIDMSILTTGVSAYARQQQAELKNALKQVIEREVKSPTIKGRLFNNFRSFFALPTSVFGWKSKKRLVIWLKFGVDSRMKISRIKCMTLRYRPSSLMTYWFVMAIWSGSIRSEQHSEKFSPKKLTIYTLPFKLLP